MHLNERRRTVSMQPVAHYRVVRPMIVLAPLLLAASAPLGAQGARLGAAESWSGIPLGPHAVGYELLYLMDPSRTLLPDTTPRARAAAAPRTIPLRIWFPAANAPSASRATMADIIGDRGRRGRGAIPPMAAELRERTMSLHPYAAQKYARAGGTELVAADTVGLVARVLAMRTHARLGVPASAGRRRPVVVFAGGTAHSTDENVALWEHLASHGYVVAAIPTVSMKVGPGYLPDDALGLETIARDF